MQTHGSRISWTQQQLEKIEGLEEIFRKYDMHDFRWIETRQFVTAQWVRMKCMFGCDDYGKCAACPPNVPGVAECERFFSEYLHAVIFHFHTQLENPDDRHAWTAEITKTLLQVERAVFLAGHEKTFLLFPDNCHFCKTCTEERSDCKQPRQARPTPEALGMDVYSTVRTAGYPIQVLPDYDQTMNRYAFLLVE